MFKIDGDNNEILPVPTRSFSELGFKERAHLQEWIAKQPACLGEELLIIQKEFAGFSDTQERLDLLALDKQGSLVIVENKLDDTGRDVAWQALKYASYCSSLSTENIRSIFQDYLKRMGSSEKAESILADFFEVGDYEEVVLNKGVTQRIILIAANFRKEVTSTVLWLLNFKLRIQCFKVTPFSTGSDLYINFEQIIPTKEAEEYMIGIAEKAQDEIAETSAKNRRHTIRKNFWTKLLPSINAHSALFQNRSPGTATWLAGASGMSGVQFTFGAAGSYGRVEVYIDRGNRDENKWIFDQLLQSKQEIEQELDLPLQWERLDEKQGCRIKCERPANIYDAEQWPTMIEYMTDAMIRLERAFKRPIEEINLQFKNR